jgi:hypothetical protein
MFTTPKAHIEQVLKLKIHGDNVVECDRALKHIEEALEFRAEWLSASDPRRPTFAGSSRSVSRTVEITLLPGHGRWGYDIPLALAGLGSTIRENADAVISVKEEDGERIILAMEFCGALPAGNNAWQRHGRAYSFGQAGIPYLIYSEVGGQELYADRTEKSSRLPNPAVPYSLVLFSRHSRVPVLPVYEAAPSATEDDRAAFLPAMGKEAGLDFLRATLLGADTTSAVLELEKRALDMAKLVGDRRKRVDGYNADQWRALLGHAGAPSDYHLTNGRGWSRKLGEKVVATATARKLQTNLHTLDPISIGSDGLPFLMIRPDKKLLFGQLISKIYDADTAKVLRHWLFKAPGPVALVLITGFKPAGDDSRPDRGLVPLARMLLGPSIRIMTMVWGPARATLLRQIQHDAQAAAESHGLLQAIFSCSDMVLVDSINSSPFCLDTSSFGVLSAVGRAVLPRTPIIPPLGEHDVDSIFHFISTRPRRTTVIEGMCNPPGGDWSGINIELADGSLARWTSLPRVSLAKRPDHVVQLKLASGTMILSVESKQRFADLEANVGPRLKKYMEALLTIGPGVVRKPKSGVWERSGPTHRVAVALPVYSFALATAAGSASLEDVRSKYDLDFIASFALNKAGTVLVNARSRPGLENLLSEVMTTLAKDSSVGIEVRVD